MTVIVRNKPAAGVYRDFTAHLICSVLLLIAAATWSADGKPAGTADWVVHKLDSWEISTPEGFGFRQNGIGNGFREWSREWDKQYLSRPDAEGWVSYSERITVTVGRTANTRCGAVPLPPR